MGLWLILCLVVYHFIMDIGKSTGNGKAVT